ncbi:MAG: hypothetical protein A2341_07145 [Deltaproteobacteria bacterium RIFOXYB12_FULL_58_9]|nr:MAG: hypothetical protein A2341_07145 [Deltaproteobacteria bacterium RIFOXYB12_FULL_58_9]
MTMAQTEPLKAIVRNGRVVVEERVDYPDGTVLELEVAEPMDKAELIELDAALAESQADIDAGRVRPAEEFIKDLRASR